MLHRTLRRRAATLAAGALASTALTAIGLSGTAAPAAAAAVPTLSWEISPRFDAHLSTHELSGGATEDGDGVITFVNGVGGFDTATGVGSVEYDGTVSGTFVAGSPVYSVTVSDPVVSVGSTGKGSITALVSARVYEGFGQPASVVEPGRVTMTTFDAAAGRSVADGLARLTATPDWAGVLPSGPESAALGIPSGQPVDGKSWSTELLGRLPAGLRAHFYASGAASDAQKAPAAFTATGLPSATPAPTPAVTASVTYRDHAATIAVNGSGFRAVTNPGDAGVYVGLAPVGGLPDVTAQAGMGSFAASAWVMPSQIVNGSFAVALQPATDKLDRTRSYAVYTWQAHTHSNTTQDTTTPITLDWTRLTATGPTPVTTKAPATVKGKLAKRPTTARPGRLVVSLASSAGTPTGKVTVRLVRAGAKAVTRSARLRHGRAVVTLPRLRAGTWTARIAYAGSETVQAASKALRIKVRKAAAAR